MFKPVESTINFIEMEKKWLKQWEESGVIVKYLAKNNKASRKFFHLDGPITANNPMGVHHAWGRTYKDIWKKFHNLLGHKQRFQNGFDCQGLWVEVEVEKELGLKSKKDIENLVPGNKKASIAKFVEMCKQRVYKFSGIQAEQSKRLAYFMDWDHSYFTMSNENNYMIWYFLKKCFDNGWIYKGHESVPWCPRCETAISQHEMLTEDYKEVVHESIYFSLPIVDRENEFLLVWTTTPWTIPANVAVAVDAKLDYTLVEVDNKRFWVAKELAKTIFGGAKIVKTVKGKELVGLQYDGPFDYLERVKKVAEENKDTFHTVVATDDNILSITTTEGTGLVHTAVSAGVEDFKLGKKYGLPMIPVIADNADYFDGMGEFSGKNAKKHPELIIDALKKHESGKFLYKTMPYKHRYPACWRCKTELVWKVADEWYISMDVPFEGKTLRQRMVAVAKKITWMPEFGLDRELDWLKNMHDWLISKKNRYWGLAIPIYECKKCSHFEVLGGFDELKERAVAGWSEFEGKTPHKPYIDEVKIKCAKCGEVVSRVDDVGNPWLDAGIVPFSTLVDPESGKLSYITDKKYFKEWFPADFITESFPGQFKNWFYALIAMSTVLENTIPFKTVLGFATLVGEDGRPMHKSWGNSVEFNEGADKIGVDVMRWMYARQNPADNMLFGYKKADEVRRQFYLILWNSYKFFVDYAVQDGFSDRHSGKRSASRIDSGVTSFPRMTNVLDIWIFNRFVWFAQFAKKELLEYSAKDVALEGERFVNDLSTWHIRRSRDRVGANSDNEQDKKEFYQVLHFIFTNLSVVLSPILPFVTEEMYTNLTGKESIYLEDWPEFDSFMVNEKLIEDMLLIREIVEVGHRARKERQLKVRQPLQSATVYFPKTKNFNTKGTDTEYKNLIKGELNVKEVEYKQTKSEELTVELDTNLTEELKLEGELRDLIRSIQQERKARNIGINEPVSLTVPKKFSAFKDLISKKVHAKSIVFGESVRVE